MRLIACLAAMVVLGGCMKTAGYYARSDECKRLGHYQKGDEKSFRPHSREWGDCMARLHKQGFARELDPKGVRGTYRPLTVEGLSGGLLTNSPRQPSPQPTPQDFGIYKRSYVDGMNRICIYNDMGSKRITTVSAADLCPM